MSTGGEIEDMAKNCRDDPDNCKNLGSVIKGMTPLCLKEWKKEDNYHPYCYAIVLPHQLIDAKVIQTENNRSDTYVNKIILELCDKRIIFVEPLYEEGLFFTVKRCK